MSFTLGGKTAAELRLRLTAPPNVPILPPTVDRIMSVPGKNGAYDFGADLGPRSISLECGIVETDIIITAQLQEVARNFATHLVDIYGKPKTVELRFDREPDKYYMVRYSGNLPIEELVAMGYFTLPLVAFDPYAYGDERIITIGGPNTFFYGPTFPTIIDQYTILNPGSVVAKPRFLVRPKNIYDNFYSRTTSSFPEGWTERWPIESQDWTVEIDGSAAGGKVLSYTSTNDASSLITFDMLDGVKNIEVLAKVKVPTGGWQTRMFARASGPNRDSGNGHFIELIGNAYLRLGIIADGSISANQEWFGWDYDTWYYLKFQLSGEELKGKAWKDGDPEPEEWMIQRTDPDPRAGWMGFSTHSLGSGFEFDFISAATEDPAEEPDIMTAWQVEYKDKILKVEEDIHGWEILELNFLNKTITRNGDNILSSKTAESEFFDIEPGEDLIDVGSDGENVTEIYLSPRWL